MRGKRIIAPAGALVALAGALAGCGGNEMAEPEGATEAVRIQTFIFRPDPVEVEAGGTIEWTNEDEILHTVTSGTRESPAGRFDHQLDGVGATARTSFERPGTYEYFCSVHNGMEGRVVVR